MRVMAMVRTYALSLSCVGSGIESAFVSLGYARNSPPMPRGEVTYDPECPITACPNNIWAKARATKL